MSKGSFILDEEYIKSVSTAIRTECDAMEQLLESYIGIMRGITETAITRGITSESIKVFVEAAEILNNKYADLGSCVYVVLQKYLDNVDDADQYIY